MSMYIMKPWYNVQKKKTTTFATFSLSSLITSWTGTDPLVWPSSLSRMKIFVENYKSISTSTSQSIGTNQWNRGTTNSLYMTCTYPEIRRSDMDVTGSLYNVWSSNATEQYLNNSKVTIRSTNSGRSLYVAIGMSDYTYESNTDYGRFNLPYGNTIYGSNIVTYTYNNAASSDNMLYIARYNGYGNEYQGYFELSDPYKVTIFTETGDNFQSMRYHTGHIYRATLSEVPA